MCENVLSPVLVFVLVATLLPEPVIGEFAPVVEILELWSWVELWLIDWPEPDEKPEPNKSKKENANALVTAPDEPISIAAANTATTIDKVLELIVIVFIWCG